MADDRGASGAELVGSQRFELLERLGSGSGGEVFRAHDRERGSDIALKRLKKGDPTSLYRFKQEFRALADVAHPNLVEYYELVASEDQWFLTMEYIDGVDFLTYVRKGDDEGDPSSSGDDDEQRRRSGGGGEWDEEDTAVTRTGTGMPQRRGLRFEAQFERLRAAMAQLALGVQALHDAGHLHRDIKPTNILVGSGGRLAILDFGVVTELARLDIAADEDHIVGTPAYMAPEQAAGEPLSPGSDWYSVGVVLYEALTGARPFGGRVRSSLEARKRFDPPAPSTFAPGTPPDLDELCMLLLRRDPSARPDGREVLQVLGVERSAVAPARGRAGDPNLLVGREPHLAALRNAFEEACRGRSHAVLVHGATGMGKTALVQAFLRQISLERRAIVLEGRCYEHESMPYKALDPLVDALSRHLLSLPRADVESVMPGDMGALARLFPVLRRVEAVVGGAVDPAEKLEAVELRRRAVAALRELIARLAASRPLVLYIDDLQWGDTDSAALIQELLRPPQTPGLLFVASYRSEDAGTSPFLRALLPLPSVPIEIALTALSSVEALVIAERLLGGVSRILPTIGRSIARESGGNPFFVHELVRYVQAETFSDMSLGTITLEEVIRVRITELPRSARRVLDLIAVAGHPVSTATARRAIEMGSELDRAVHLLRARNLIRTRGGGERGAGAMEPYHDRIREVAVALLDANALRDVHRGLAMALSVEVEPDPEALAAHFEGAGDYERASQYVVAAAELAVRALAFDRAVDLYLRALAMRTYPRPEESRLRAGLASALADGGRGAEAAENYLVAAEDAPPGDALAYRRMAGEHLLRAGHFERGLEVLDGVMRELGLRRPTNRTWATVSFLWGRLLLRLGGFRYRARDEREVAPVQLERVDTTWAAAAAVAMVDTVLGAELQVRHLRLALGAGERWRVARAMALEAGLRSIYGVRARKRFDAAVAEGERLSEILQMPTVDAWVQGVRGLGAYQFGEFAEARRLCASTVEALTEHASSLFYELTSMRLMHVWSLYYLGELSEVAERVPELLREASEHGDRYSATNFSTGLCVAAWLVRDAPEEIRTLGDDALARWSHRTYHLQHYWYFLGRMMIELYEGDPTSVWRAFEEHWPAYRASFMTRMELAHHECLSIKARAELCAAGHAIDEKRGLSAARATARALTRKGRPYGVGWGRLVEAAVAARQGDGSGALEALDAAEKAFTTADMALYTQAVRWRRGELIGGDEGAAQVAAARAWFEGQSVVRPEKFVNMLAPGFVK